MLYHTKDGAFLYYETQGKGRPLLLLHGNGESHLIFEKSRAELAEHFLLVLPDERGHGQSSPVLQYHYQQMAEDMAALIRHLNLSDVLFAGFSDGAIVAILTCLLVPDRISGLILCGANTSPKAVVPSFRIRAGLEYFRTKNPLIKLMLTEPHITDDMLQKIQVPTLVAAGQHDLIPRKETEHIHRMIQGSTLMILDGEDHGSYVHNGKIFPAIILGFTGGKK